MAEPYPSERQVCRGTLVFKTAKGPQRTCLPWQFSNSSATPKRSFEVDNPPENNLGPNTPGMASLKILILIRDIQQPNNYISITVYAEEAPRRNRELQIWLRGNKWTFPTHPY